MGAFAGAYLFVSNVHKPSFPITEDLAFFEDVTKNNCVVSEMRRGILEVHVVRENGGFVLFGLEPDLDKFFFYNPAKDVVIFVKVVNLAGS